MNRVLTDDDRIRRAEVIAERRKSFDLYDENDEADESIHRFGKIRLIVQILVCLCIYCGLHYLKSTKTNNSIAVMTNIKSILEYDIDFKDIFDSLMEKMERFTTKENDEINKKVEDNVQNNSDSNIQENEPKENGIENRTSQKMPDIVGIGGELSVTENEEILNQNDDSDIDYIKKKISLTKPLNEYVITSTYGNREASDIISANHKGIDLGAHTGTIIKSASDGVVIEASSNGDFGNHLVVQKDDITIIYGHCSELLVSEGDTVTNGQEIAKVGATRKGNRGTFTL